MVQTKISIKLMIISSLMIFLTTGCVTINVYFPAAAAEKAADKLIEEIWQLKQNQNTTKPKADTNSSK